MNGPTGPQRDGWERVVEELQACKDSQRRAWGDVDNLGLGRYLAGAADPAEAADIERALDELPDLRQLTAIVRGVLDDLGPVAWDGPPLEAPPPAVRPVRPRPRRRPGVVGWLRRQAPLVAAACLLVILAAAMPAPAPLAGPRGGVNLTDARAMRGGLPEPGAAAAGRSDLALTTSPIWAAPQARFAPAAADLPAPLRDATKRAFVYFHQDGDLCRAAQESEAILAYCNTKLRADDPARARAVWQLADLYQAALNTSPSGATGQVVALSSVRAKGAPAKAVQQARLRAGSAAQLSREIDSRPVGEVRAKVVPVLTEALVAAPAPADRRRFLRALARVGPAADQAVPALTAQLARTTDAGEAADLLAVIAALGPGGRAAMPVLAELGGVPAPKRAAEPTAAPLALAAREQGPRPAASPVARKRAAELHARLQGRDGKVGVHDRAGCFSLRAAREATARLRAFAKDHGVEVLVETTTDAVVESRLLPADQLPARTIHVLISLKGPTVHVRAGGGVRALAAEVIRAADRARDCARERNYDDALREVMAALLKAPR